MKYYFHVVLDLPISSKLIYFYDSPLIIGQRVLVPIKSRRLIGFIWEFINETHINFNIDEIKSITNIFPQVIPQDLLKLAQFASKYYHYKLGNTLFNIIPSSLRKNRILPYLDTAIIELTNLSNLDKNNKKSIKKAQLISVLKNNSITINEAKNILGRNYKAILNNLLDDNLIRINTLNHRPKKVFSVDNNINLNLEQQNIVDQINTKFNIFSVNVIYGITGSGKTEIYFALIEKALILNLQVLYLVPEINLTPQLLNRFKRRFNDIIINVITSDVDENQRFITYENAFLGNIQIIIGTRMASFFPFNNLGLIIVDEEHDTSFKQNDSLRYNARDLLIYRAHINSIPIVLGSATLSLETYYNCKINKFQLYTLKTRAICGAALSPIKLIDLNNHKIINGLTQCVIEKIQDRINKNELSLVFINRRGYAPVISCFDCGWVAKCSACSTNLVYHLKDNLLKCHHCGIEKKVSTHCEECHSLYLHTIGYGTQKIENELKRLFPQAKILRIDKDSINSENTWDKIYNDINNNQYNILVGTQMLSKGHDFHNITLVVGLNLDSALFSYDFRASEYLFAQLLQVSGRAGRGIKLGEVLLQTYYPQHEIYHYLQKYDYFGFADYQLSQRQLLKLPPYSYYAMIRMSAFKIDIINTFIQKFYTILKNFLIDGINILPPVKAVIQKLNNKERMQILIMSKERNLLQEYLSTVTPKLQNICITTELKWHLDVDPQEM